jgi:hypothetical protein
VVSAVALLVLLAGCGSSSDDAPNVLSAGQIDIQLPAGYKVVDGKVQRPAQAASSGDAGSATATSGPTDTTIVATKEDPATAMFTALGKFRKCLDDSGTKFIGAPNQADPNSPTNDPTYIQNLSTCAARSNIVQALQAQRDAAANQTPEQIEESNKGYLKWRTCMIDRGWKVPKPTPDAEGRLFSFGGGGGNNSQPQIEGPPGKDILSSNDTQECAAKAQSKS